ncbi:galactose mutarotase-like domain-containing protein [Tirmania nivea]|nr:galactose mutarotase-like domain-containing protein [Tirmania nivea]
MHSSNFLYSLLLPLALLPYASADFSLKETSSAITLSNTRFTAILRKSSASITKIYLDGQDLLGPTSGSFGKGPYADCHCTPSGAYTIGHSSPKFTVVNGTDSTGVPWGGIILADTYARTGQQFEQYWFLRGEETGLHMFTRVMYKNEKTPFLMNLQELRTLFRPNTPLWTHLSVTEDQWAPLPGKEAVSKKKVVQDATWSLAAVPGDKYVQQASEYFTKYTFSNNWKTVIAHGLFADGSTSNGISYGAWTVMNTKDTYYGGPLHSDLTVDGIVYNYIVSKHHGSGSPNITTGLDRTFGPQYIHFNSYKSKVSTPVIEKPGAPPYALGLLRRDAEKYSDSSWDAEFYDSIAKYVPGYVPTSRRGSLAGEINLPKSAKNPVAVLSASGMHFQDNAAAPHEFQYWTNINAKTGQFQFKRVVDGKYRLTVYADGVFGEFFVDGVVVKAGKVTPIRGLQWKEESSGNEIWRIGIPDRSSGEFRHGNKRDETHPIGLKEHTIYWGAYSFQTDFPQGVNYTVGASNPATDLNYVHWGAFAPPSQPKFAGSTTNKWRINFKLSPAELKGAKTATLTIQLAGARTAAGNSDEVMSGEKYDNVPLVARINGYSGQETTMVVPWYKSSSCAVRSAVSCNQVREKLRFDVEKVRVGWNELVLELPIYGAIYVQYDALRLEVS